MKHSMIDNVNVVNGLVVGQHLGAPMQDAVAAKPEDNEVYATERNTVSRVHHSKELWDDQPKPASGGVSSWNDLTDKPFYEETKLVNEPLNITWDGNTEGLVCVDASEAVGEPANFYKVSDNVFTDEQIKLMFYHDCSHEFSPFNYAISDVWGRMVDGGFVTADLVALSDFSVVFVRKKNATLVFPNGWATPTFPECGVYFKSVEWEGDPAWYVDALTSTESMEHTKVEAHKLSKRFLDDTVYEKTCTYIQLRDEHLYFWNTNTIINSEQLYDIICRHNIVIDYECKELYPIMFGYDDVGAYVIVYDGQEFKRGYSAE